jgi:hypothetical protein
MGLQRLQSQAHPHQALHIKNQREGRAVHQDPAGGMGLRHGSIPQRESTVGCPYYLGLYNWHRGHMALGRLSPQQFFKRQMFAQLLI